MANEATWSQSDRTRIQDEINQLMAEIDEQVFRTEFNTRKLLDGSLSESGVIVTPGTPNVPNAPPEIVSLKAADVLYELLATDAQKADAKHSFVDLFGEGNFPAAQGRNIFSFSTAADAMGGLTDALIANSDYNFVINSLNADLVNAAVERAFNAAIQELVGFKGDLAVDADHQRFQGMVKDWLHEMGAWDPAGNAALTQPGVPDLAGLFANPLEGHLTAEQLLGVDKARNAIAEALGNIDLSVFLREADPDAAASINNLWSFVDRDDPAFAADGNMFRINPNDRAAFTDWVEATQAVNHAIASFITDHLGGVATGGDPHSRIIEFLNDINDYTNAFFVDANSDPLAANAAFTNLQQFINLMTNEQIPPSGTVVNAQDWAAEGVTFSRVVAPLEATDVINPFDTVTRTVTGDDGTVFTQSGAVNAAGNNIVWNDLVYGAQTALSGTARPTDLRGPDETAAGDLNASHVIAAANTPGAASGATVTRDGNAVAAGDAVAVNDVVTRNVVVDGITRVQTGEVTSITHGGGSDQVQVTWGDIQAVAAGTITGVARNTAVATSGDDTTITAGTDTPADFPDAAPFTNYVFTNPALTDDGLLRDGDTATRTVTINGINHTQTGTVTDGEGDGGTGLGVVWDAIDGVSATNFLSTTAAPGEKSGVQVRDDLLAAINGALERFLVSDSDEGDGGVAAPGGDGKGGLWFQVGANAGQGVRLNIEAVNVAALSMVGERAGVEEGFAFKDLRSDDTTFKSMGQGVLKESGEQISKFLTAIDFALSHTTSQRSNLGAMQNRLEFTIENLNISSENLSAAESRIRDADMALEMMRFTQSNILQQAAISMLAQANQAPNMLLSLLR
jgi:flagellin-like hook-associated protein FlgL